MEDLSHYEKEIRPWGQYERFTRNEQTTVKIVTVNPGGVLSLQHHAHRAEFWHIISGSGEVTIGEEKKPAQAGDNFFVALGQTHRLEGGPAGVALLEIAFGDFDEKDITRLEDKYGRT